MLRVAVDINGKVDVAILTAVRTHPKTKTVEEGTMCTYTIYYSGEPVDYMKGVYGCGVDLAIQLLERYKKNATLFKTKAMILKMEKMK